MKTVLAEKEQVIVNASRQRIGVVLDSPTYKHLRETVEENLQVCPSQPKTVFCNRV